MFSWILRSTRSPIKKHIQFCDICPRAKHAFSDSRGAAWFDLLHVDIWSSYRKSGAHSFLTLADDNSHAIWASVLVREFCVMIRTQF